MYFLTSPTKLYSLKIWCLLFINKKNLIETADNSRVKKEKKIDILRWEKKATCVTWKVPNRQSNLWFKKIDNRLKKKIFHQGSSLLKMSPILKLNDFLYIEVLLRTEELVLVYHRISDIKLLFCPVMAKHKIPFEAVDGVLAMSQWRRDVHFLKVK